MTLQTSAPEKIAGIDRGLSNPVKHLQMEREAPHRRHRNSNLFRPNQVHMDVDNVRWNSVDIFLNTTENVKKCEDSNYELIFNLICCQKHYCEDIETYSGTFFSDT